MNQKSYGHMSIPKSTSTGALETAIRISKLLFATLPPSSLKKKYLTNEKKQPAASSKQKIVNQLKKLIQRTERSEEQNHTRN